MVQRMPLYFFVPQESKESLNSNLRLSASECVSSMRDNLDPVVDGVDLLLAELRALKSQGPHLRIMHRFREPGMLCAPGEEIVIVYIVRRGWLYPLRLSLALRMLIDYLAKHSHFPQSASQIEAGMRADPFYIKHGANAMLHNGLKRRISRSAIKEYVKRLRLALELTFREAGLSIDPRHTIVSAPTVTNEVGYRLKATAEWFHID
jgi:hypothetical protein